MRTKPILFSAPMVRAILDGSKTQTRRIVKQQPRDGADLCLCSAKGCGGNRKWHLLCPYGQPGDQLWVQENHRLRNPIEATESVECNYAEDGEQQMVPLQNREFVKMMLRENRVGSDYGAIIPGRFMYKSLSRITLEITGIRVERLQDISEEDAIAEGIERHTEARYGYKFYGGELERMEQYTPDSRFSYQTLWESINGPGSWEANPWVWVVEFRRVKP